MSHIGSSWPEAMNIVRLLLQSGANGSLKDSAGDTAFDQLKDDPNVWLPDWKRIDIANTPKGNASLFDILSSSAADFVDKKGTINDDDVRIRTWGNIYAPVVGGLLKGSIVEAIGRTAIENVVEDKTGYWYHIKTQEGLSGWCFGSFVSFAKDEQ